MVSRYTMVWIHGYSGYRRCEQSQPQPSSTSHNITHYTLHTARAGPDCRCHYHSSDDAHPKLPGQWWGKLVWLWSGDHWLIIWPHLVWERGDRRYNLYRLSTALIHLRKWLLLVILPTHNHRRDSWAQFRQYLKRLSSSFTVSIHVTKHLRHKITTRDKWLGMIWAQT